jgi:hypothetical protein
MVSETEIPRRRVQFANVNACMSPPYYSLHELEYSSKSVAIT